jgi:exopolyphosphatase/guanosine-5'-triphosphate,3'-diphosphate pyrophosphatase
VVAEIQARQPVKILEEATRGVPLGRDAFSTGVIQSDTVEAAIQALEVFRQILETYGVVRIRAVATSAVREARNGEMFLDRIRRHWARLRIINEAEESRLVYLAVRHKLGNLAAFKGEWTLVVEVGGGSTDLTLLRRGRPNRSGVYALGAIRMRQQLNLSRQRPELQVSLIKRYVANVIEEMRVDIPLDRVTHMIAIGGDVRFAASQLPGKSDDVRTIPREEFVAFCDQVEGMDEEAIADRFRLRWSRRNARAGSSCIGRSSPRPARAASSSPTRRCAAACSRSPSGGRLGAADFERQVLASADALGVKYRYDRPHGKHVATLSVKLFDALVEEHGLGGREQLLLRWRLCCTTSVDS